MSRLVPQGVTIDLELSRYSEFRQTMGYYCTIHCGRSDGRQSLGQGRSLEINEPTPEQLNGTPDGKGVVDYYKKLGNDDTKSLDWRRKLAGMLTNALGGPAVVGGACPPHGGKAFHRVILTWTSKANLAYWLHCPRITFFTSIKSTRFLRNTSTGRASSGELRKLPTIGRMLISMVIRWGGGSASGARRTSSLISCGS